MNWMHTGMARARLHARGTPGLLTGLRWAGFAAASAVLLAACGGDDGSPTYPAPTIQVLSTRADMVSGGDALVEITLAAGVSLNSLQVDVGGRDVTAQFVPRPALNNRLVGVIRGTTHSAMRTSPATTSHGS